MTDRWWYTILDTATNRGLWFIPNNAGVKAICAWTLPDQINHSYPYNETDIEYFECLNNIEILYPLDRKFSNIDTNRLDEVWVFLNGMGLDNILIVPHVVDTTSYNPMYKDAFWMKDL